MLSASYNFILISPFGLNITGCGQILDDSSVHKTGFSYVPLHPIDLTGQYISFLQGEWRPSPTLWYEYSCRTWGRSLNYWKMSLHFTCPYSELPKLSASLIFYLFSYCLHCSKKLSVHKNESRGISMYTMGRFSAISLNLCHRFQRPFPFSTYTTYTTYLLVPRTFSNALHKCSSIPIINWWNPLGL